MTDVNVRGIDADLWQKLRVAAVQCQVPTGKLLNDIIRQWLVLEAIDTEMNNVVLKDNDRDFLRDLRDTLNACQR